MFRAGTTLEEIKDAAEFFRIAAARARYRPTTGAWSYPLTTGSLIAGQALAVTFGCTLIQSNDYSTRIEKIQAETAHEEATRRLLQPYLDDPQRPLSPYTTLGHKPPWRHQSVSWHWAMRISTIYFAHKPGLGKTRTGADIIKGWYELSRIRTMVPTQLPAKYSESIRGKIIPPRVGVVGGVLIVCPRVVTDTWREETFQFQGLACVIIKGPAPRKRYLAGCPAWAHIVSYGSLEHVEENQYDAIILDEAHFIANEESLRFRKLIRMRGRATHAIALSGTPVSNMLPSLWAQYYWLDGGRSLGASRAVFTQRYFDREGRDLVPKPNALQDISAAVGRITYFLRKEDALPWLPAKLPPQSIRVPMTASQRAYYEQVRVKTEAQILAGRVSVSEIHTKMMKLAQICQGFVIDDNKNVLRFSYAKLSALEEMICGTGDLHDRKTIVWCSFTEDTEDVSRLLTKHGIPHLFLRGGMSDREREETKNQWNTNPYWRVMIGMISVGIGINLHARDCVRETPQGIVTDRCSTAIYFGLDRSVTNLEQSMDRIHRGDQVEQCLYRFILCADDEDEADPTDPMDLTIYKKLLQKLETSTMVFDEGPAWWRALVRKNS